MPSFTGKSGRRWSFDESRRLGSPSGFGEVFASADDEQEWAIKRVPLRIGDSAEMQRREREVEIAQKISASDASMSHVLVPVDWGSVGGDLFLVMPRAECSLEEMISSAEFDAEARHRAIHDIACGLAELSVIGVLHRDLKPANVLRYRSNWVLSDFGISRDAEQSTATNTFKGVGTMAYMAPETWELRPSTTRTDLYALGVLAYEVMVGRRPFNGPRPEDFMRQHTQEPPPGFDIRNGRMSRLLHRLLSKDPSGRPQDARAVVEIVKAAIARLDSSWEEVDAAAAHLSAALSYQEAAESKRMAVKGMRSEALRELGALLDDFADDVGDVFPGARLTSDSDDGNWHLALDAADIWINTVFENSQSGSAVSGSVVACAVSAKPPSRADISDINAGYYGLLPTSGSHCTANLMCDLVHGRLEWTVCTFSHSNRFPYGITKGDVFELRETAKSRAKYDQNGLMVPSAQTVQTAPLSVDAMLALLRHTFLTLSGNNAQGSPLWPGVQFRSM